MFTDDCDRYNHNLASMDARELQFSDFCCTIRRLPPIAIDVDEIASLKLRWVKNDSYCFV